MSETAHFADSDEKTINGAKFLLAEYLRGCTGRENAVSSKHLASKVGLKATTVRDLVKEVRQEYDLPIVSCSRGYYVIESTSGLESELERIDSEIETKLETKRELTEAFNRYNA